MVESVGFENRSGVYLTGGSNPSLSSNFLFASNFVRKVFPCGELTFQVHWTSHLKPSHVTLWHTLGGDVHQAWMELLFMIQALLREGVASIRLILPYMSYLRQPQVWPVLFEQLFTYRVSELLLFEPHEISEIEKWGNLRDRVGGSGGRKVHCLKAAPLFKRFLEQEHDLGASPFFGCLDNPNAWCIVAPDEGAWERAQALAHFLNCVLVRYTKTRDEAGLPLVERKSREEIQGKKALFIDDILDTGGTLLQVSRDLKRSGIQEIHVLVAHGLFSASKYWQELTSLVQSYTLTDSVPLQQEIPVVVYQRLSIAPFLHAFLKEGMDAERPW